jgi:hypothetical protein
MSPAPQEPTGSSSRKVWYGLAPETTMGAVSSVPSDMSTPLTNGCAAEERVKTTVEVHTSGGVKPRHGLTCAGCA